MIRRYNLKYSFDNVHSYLSEVQEEASNGEKLNPIMFKYDNNYDVNPMSDIAYYPSASYSPPITGSSHEVKTGDFNNDGLSDVIVLHMDYSQSSKGKITSLELYTNTTTLNNATSDFNFTKTYSKNFTTDAGYE